MNEEIFKGKWVEIKGKMRSAWGKLTDDDFTRIQGNHQEIYGRLQQAYGYSKEEAQRAVEKFKHTHEHDHHK